jgi:hypothetical protein
MANIVESSRQVFHMCNRVEDVDPKVKSAQSVAIFGIRA